MLNRLNNIIKLQPKEIIILVGTNDVSFGVSEEDIVKNFNDILIILDEQLPDSNITIISILPTDDIRKNKIISELNTQIKDLCNKYNCHFLDVYNKFLNENVIEESLTLEGLHLSERGYGILIENIERQLNLCE